MFPFRIHVVQGEHQATRKTGKDAAIEANPKLAWMIWPPRVLRCMVVGVCSVVMISRNG